jgi:hypothetical protein
VLALGQSVAKHLSLDAHTVQVELEEAVSLLSMAKDLAATTKMAQRREAWRVRERAMHWATLLSLPAAAVAGGGAAVGAHGGGGGGGGGGYTRPVSPRKQQVGEPRGDLSPSVKAAIQGAMARRKALEVDKRVLRFASSPKMVANMKALIEDVW